VIPGTLATAKARSQNSKLGEAATTYAAQTSCPSDCVFFDGGGCYAETGQVGKFVTAPLNAAAAQCEHDGLDVALAEAETIDALEVIPGRPLRLHTVGDCASNLAALIVAAAAERYMERGGGPCWTYTHAWRHVDREAWGTVSVLASCETGEDVRLARSRGYATALVVEEFESDKLYDADNGARSIHENIHAPVTHEVQSESSYRFSTTDEAANDEVCSEGANKRSDSGPQFGVGSVSSRPRESTPILPCPSQTRDVHCSDCRLCFDDQALRRRGYSIGFELHGIPLTIRRARLALADPSNPDRRRSAEEQLRELLEREPDVGPTAAARELDLSVAYASQMLSWLRGHAEHPSVLRRRRYERRRAAA
jgi:hypothetical protein